MRFKIAGVDSLIIYFGDKIDEQTATKVKKAYLSLKALNFEGLIEIIPSYTSIFIQFDISKYDYESLKFLLKNSINLNFEENFEEKVARPRVNERCFKECAEKEKPRGRLSSSERKWRLSSENSNFQCNPHEHEELPRR